MNNKDLIMELQSIGYSIVENDDAVVLEKRGYKNSIIRVIVAQDGVGYSFIKDNWEKSVYRQGVDIHEDVLTNIKELTKKWDRDENKKKKIYTDLYDSITSLDLINNDLTKNDLLLSILNNNLNKIKSHNESTGKRIAIATINQMIASDELWIIEDKINFLKITNTDKSMRPSNSQVLASDAKGMVLTLLYGGWSTPIGWCGAMFVGAGASIGSYMGSPIGWPF